METVLLCKRKCSTFDITVYECLTAYAMKDLYCYPSIKTIIEWCMFEGKYESLKSQISRSITKLENKGFLEKGNQRSKRRFKLTLRRNVQVAKGIIEGNTSKAIEVLETCINAGKKVVGEVIKFVNPRLTNQSTDKRREKKDNLYTKKYKKKSYISKKEQVRREAQRAKQLKKKEQSAERAWALIIGHDYSVNDLTEIQRTNLSKAIKDKTLQDYDWIEEYHSKRFKKIEAQLGASF